MKSVLIIAAVFGFSASAALAECAGHQQINASVPAVDREFKTASIVPPTDPVEKPVVILKRPTAFRLRLRRQVSPKPQCSACNRQNNNLFIQKSRA